MKATLLAMFVALLMVGCGGADLDDPETLEEILTEAIDLNDTRKVTEGNRSLIHYYNDKPFSGWVKGNFGREGSSSLLGQLKNGKLHGLTRFWHENGNRGMELTFNEGNLEGPAKKWYFNGKIMYEGTLKKGPFDSLSLPWLECKGWKPNGERCPVTNIKDGNGVLVIYNNEDGTESGRETYKNGESIDWSPH